MVAPTVNKIFLSHNSGMGDAIIMNGAVRFLSTIFDKVVLLSISKHATYQQVVHMYSDVPNIRVQGEPIAPNFSRINKKMRCWAKRFPGWHIRAFNWAPRSFISVATNLGLHPEKNCYPEVFYKYFLDDMHGYYHRHKDFFVPRNLQKEQELIKILDLPSDYAFVVNRGAHPRHHYMSTPKSQFPILNPASRHDLINKYTIFDWMGVIEGAREVYTIDTAWFHLMKQMKLDKPKFYINHRGVPMKDVDTSNYLNDKWDNGWKVIVGPGLEVEGLGARFTKKQNFLRQQKPPL
jgi:hypothetical protein